MKLLATCPLKESGGGERTRRPIDEGRTILIPVAKGREVTLREPEMGTQIIVARRRLRSIYPHSHNTLA